MPGNDTADSENSGPVGDGEYTVQDGDCLESIAARAGLSWKTIWNDPQNASLKAARESPNILLPGDHLHVPQLRAKAQTCATDAKYKFVLLNCPSKLRLCVMEGGKPRANEPYQLRVDDLFFEGTTDQNGNVEVSIPPAAADGELVVGNGRVRQRAYQLQLGGMDPISTVSGVQKRLRNLGYPCPLTGEIDEETTAAIALFQNDQQLEPTGTVTEETRQKLVPVHAS